MVRVQEKNATARRVGIYVFDSWEDVCQSTKRSPALQRHNFESPFLPPAQEHVTSMLKSCISCGNRQSFSATSNKPDPCKLAQGGPCGLCLELESFDEEAQAILERLAEKRRTILEKINQRHDPFIQHLPVELASQIFSFCLPQQVFGHNPLLIPLMHSSGLRYIIPFNIVLGAICRAWRRIGWSTPRLWSTLPIRLHRCHSEVYKNLTLEWLARSAQTPLDIAIGYDHRGANVTPLTEENVDLWKPLIDIVNGCSSRWRTFNTDAPDLVLSYIKGDGRGTCILESLEVVGARRSPRRFSLTNATPAPSQLISRATPLSSIDIDLSNLTTVEIEGLCVNEWIVLLAKAPHLTTCEVGVLHPGQDKSLPPPKPMRHRGIRSLKISNQQSTEKFLDLLTLPSLVSLSYDSDYNSRKNVSTFLERSACNLRTLYDSTGRFRDLLVLAPHLQTLERLEYFMNPDDGAPLRRANGDGSTLLPNLREVLIHDGSVPWRHLVDFISLCPLKTLTVRVSGKAALVDEASARRLQDLFKNGYDIKISYRPFGENEDQDFLTWSVEAQISRI